MAELWMPGATRMDVGDHAPTDGGPAKAIGHITWDKNATAAAPAALVPYESVQSYFGTNPAGRAVASHILWDPFTGRYTQFYPANSRSKSLVDQAGGTRTNRAGSVVIQIEALFFPYCKVNGKVYARLADTPCLGWAELNAWVRSHGVPDAWPMGRPVDFTPHRSESVWESQAGWYGHGQVPENTHQDPGSWPAFVSEQEEEVALTEAEYSEIARRTVTGDSGMHDPNDATKVWALSSYVGLTYKSVIATAAKVAELETKVDAISVSGVDLDALAVKVADEIYKRMAG